MQRQQYRTVSGYDVDTIKDTYPIMDGDEVLGACSIVRDFSSAQLWLDNMMRQILEESIHKQTDEPIDYATISFNDEKNKHNSPKIKQLLQKFQNTSIFCQTSRRENPYHR